MRPEERMLRSQDQFVPPPPTVTGSLRQDIRMGAFRADVHDAILLPHHRISCTATHVSFRTSDRTVRIRFPVSRVRLGDSKVGSAAKIQFFIAVNLTISSSRRTTPLLFLGLLNQRTPPFSCSLRRRHRWVLLFLLLLLLYWLSHHVMSPSSFSRKTRKPKTTKTKIFFKVLKTVHIISILNQFSLLFVVVVVVVVVAVLTFFLITSSTFEFFMETGKPQKQKISSNLIKQHWRV